MNICLPTTYTKPGAQFLFSISFTRVTFMLFDRFSDGKSGKMSQASKSWFIYLTKQNKGDFIKVGKVQISVDKEVGLFQSSQGKFFTNYQTLVNYKHGRAISFYQNATLVMPLFTQAIVSAMENPAKCPKHPNLGLFILQNRTKAILSRLEKFKSRSIKRWDCSNHHRGNSLPTIRH